MRHWIPLLLVLGTASSAAAERVKVVEEPPLDVEREPPPKRKPIPNDSAIVGVSTVEMMVADGSGGLVPFAHGVGLSLHWLQRKDVFPTGIEASAIFAFGPDGARLYDLGVSMVGSFEIRRRLAVPFIAVGLDLAAVRIPNGDAEPDGGVTAGVHGNIGLHGFLTDTLYWRGQVGYLGAGVGGIKAELSLGYSFGS